MRSRRSYLAMLGALGAVPIAGCNHRDVETTATETTGTSTPLGTEGTATDIETRAETVRFTGGDRAAFQEALAALADGTASTLYIEEGTYRFEAPIGGGPHFTLDPATNVRIDGNGATLLFTNPLRGGIDFHGGENVVVRNLTIDYNPLPFTQGTLVAISDDKRTIRIDLDAGFPPLTHRMFTEANSVAASVHAEDGSFLTGRRNRTGRVTLQFAEIRPVTGRRYELVLDRVSYHDVRSDDFGLTTGQKLVVGARHNQAVTAINTDRLHFEDVTIRTAPGMAINGEQCSEPTMRRVTIAPPPESDRSIGPVADGIHFSHCPQGPRIEQCRIKRLRDDAIVVNAEMVSVSDVTGKQSVELSSDGKIPVDTGDILEVVSAAGKLKGRLPPVVEIEYRQLNHAEWAPSWPVELGFKLPVADVLEQGYYLTNPAYHNQGFNIVSTMIRNGAANAIRLAAREGRVVDNTIDGTRWRGIALRSDILSDGEPQPWCSDITIRGNRISGAGMSSFAQREPAGVHITANVAEGKTIRGHPHRAIEIVENEIHDGAYIGIEINHAADIALRRNELRDLNRLPFPDNGGFGIGLNNVRNVSVTENRVSGLEDQLYQFGWRHDSNTVTASDNTLRIGGQAVAPELLTWTPVYLTFDRTVHPAEDRHIAFQCHGLSLVDEAGTEVVAVTIGGREMPVEFGEGVYSIDSEEGDRWRWFGGSEKRSTLYFPDKTLADATILRLRGKPIKEGISARIHRGGPPSDQVTFNSTETVRKYQLSLP